MNVAGPVEIHGRGAARALAGLLVGFAVLAGGAPPAAAHDMGPAGQVSVALTLGHSELTVTMSPPVGGPGPMPVQVAVRGAALPGPVRLQAQPAGAPAAQGPAELAPRTGVPARGVVQIDRTGGWELVIAAGSETGRIPLTVAPALPTPVWSWVVRVGLVIAVVCGIALAAVGRRRPRSALVLGALTLVGVSITATAAVLSSGLADPSAAASTPAPAPAAMPGMAGMAGDTAVAVTMGAHGPGAVVLTPVVEPRDADRMVPLTLRLTDGSTGAPVDDVVAHDDSLMHLAVIGPGGRLWHVHPLRVAPGRYAVRLPLAEAGRYGVFAEVVRADGGHQVARSAFALGASAAPAPHDDLTAAPAGPGTRDVAGMRVDVSAEAPAAGRPTRVELRFAQDGAPVRDLQAWLGMAGHLMVLGPAAAGPDPTDPAQSFAHVHDMDPPVGYGYGPVIGFDYTFPAAGRYQLWAQVLHGWQLITIPVVVDVAPPA